VSIQVDVGRLLADLEALAAVGDTGDGGNCRLALTDDDAGGRELVVGWMRALGLSVRIDRIGNVVGTRAGTDPDATPVMTGSHIDTVRTGGRYDGTLGVLAGLEVVRALDDAGHTTRRPLAVAFFTDEEGSRFAPDMLGSLVYAGGLDLESALATVGIDGAVLGDELERIGWAGDVPVPGLVPHAFVELHIEQGPVLEQAGEVIGAVTGVQGISWQELTLTGQSNHAGTTPLALRHDAGLVAAQVAAFVRALALDLGPPMVGTVGRLRLHPDLVNVVAASAVLTADLRHTDDATLRDAESRLRARVDELAAVEGVSVGWRELARFAPVVFDPAVVARVEAAAQRRGLPCRRMPSGAGHDAQMLARTCPTGMVFVPSHEGISHNPREFTSPEHLEAGASVLCDVLVELAG
jgi:beta-ureidopropionase / N-carbamoyl-L-amino-acid hydrolase